MKHGTEEYILSNLNKYFGYKTLRPGQLSIIQNILKGRDVLVCKETGFGKSLSFQLPGLMRSGVMVIITPFQSRVENKCLQLSLLKNIKSAYLSSNDGPGNVQDLRSVLDKKNKILDDLRNVRSTKLKFLYVTLEYFINSSRLKNILKEIYDTRLLQAIVIDEVHHVSQWSNLFSKDYRNLGSLRDLYPNLPFLCFTGPMSTKSLTIIQETLNLKKAYTLNEPSVRGNVSFKVMYKGETFPYSKLVEFVKIVYPNKSGFIYCQNQDRCEGLIKELQDNNMRSTYYNNTSAMDDEKAWLHWINSYGIIVVCLSGANIDVNLHKVDFVIHETIPSCLDIYVQESEKVGRNGCPSSSLIFYNAADCDMSYGYIFDSYKERIKHANTELKRKLEAELKDHLRNIFDVVVYSENISVCRQVFLLTYLNEENVGLLPCGICDVCELMKDSFIVDLAYVLRKILMAIWAINRHQKNISENNEFIYASRDNIVNLLLGTVKKCFMNSPLIKDWFFGSFISWDQQVVQRFIFILLSHKFIVANHTFNDSFEIFENLIITTKGQEFVKSNNELHITLSRKDIAFTKWLNVDWIKIQFKKDLESVVSFYNLHNDQHIFNCYTAYIENLFQDVPGTWENFKNIKLKYVNSIKSDLDEDLFTVCLIYHQILRSNYLVLLK